MGKEGNQTEQAQKMEQPVQQNSIEQAVQMQTGAQQQGVQEQTEQKQWKQMFYTQKYNYELQETQLAYERSQKMTNVREAIEKVMPHAYDQIDHVKSAEASNSQKLSRLHYARGTKLLSENKAGDVLEFDLGGSGYYMPRRMHRGFEERKEENIFDGKTGKNIHAGLNLREKIFSWIPGIRSLFWSKEELKTIRDSEQLKKRDETIEKNLQREYGQKAEIGKKKYDHIRVKKGEHKTRISMAGPLMLKGALNLGEYDIEHLRENMMEMGTEYLKNIFLKWDKQGEDPHNIAILIRGHSRGGVAASEGAMMIKYWLNQNYPEYEQYVKFELTQMDPVLGYGSRHGINEEVNHNGRKIIEEKKDKMMPLGESQDTTVVYSLRTNHGIGFAPQAVKGAKRVILMAEKHDVGMNMTDSNATVDENGEEEYKLHRSTYTDAQTMEAYRGSALNELAEGIYMTDEQNNLIRLNSYADAKKIVDTILTDKKSTQDHRREVVDKVLKAWFGEKEIGEVRKDAPQADLTGSSIADEVAQLETEAQKSSASDSYLQVLQQLKHYQEVRTSDRNTADFYQAENAVMQYLESHKGKRHSEKGERRNKLMYQIRQTLAIERQAYFDGSPKGLGTPEEFEKKMTGTNYVNRFQAFMEYNKATLLTYYDENVFQDKYYNASNEVNKLDINPAEKKYDLSEEDKDYREALGKMAAFEMVTKACKMADAMEKLKKEAPKGVSPEEYAYYMVSFRKEGLEFGAVQTLYIYYKSLTSEKIIPYINKELKEKMPDQVKKFNELFTMINGRFVSPENVEKKMPEDVRKKRDAERIEMLQQYKGAMTAEGIEKPGIFKPLVEEKKEEKGKKEKKEKTEKKEELKPKTLAELRKERRDLNKQIEQVQAPQEKKKTAESV